MILKRLLAAIILVMILISAAACDKADNIGSNENTNQNVSDGDADEMIISETTTERLYADIPTGIDYGGYEFRILGRVDGWDQWDLVAEEADGEPINDAIYYRNMAIEESLNIKIVHIPAPHYDVNGPALRAINSGEDAHDIVMPAITSAAALANSGALIQLADLDYMDLSKPWYDQSMQRDLTIGGKLFYILSDMTIVDRDAVWAYLYNKDMLTDYGLDQPYMLVKEDKWTIDKFTEMCKEVTMDIDGDGSMTENDRWGLVSHDSTITAMYIASGEKIAKVGSDGLPYLSMETPRVTTVVDKILSFYDYWYKYALTARSYGETQGMDTTQGYTNINTLFNSGNALFLGEVLEVVSEKRDLDTDFGILPTPKLDENQEEYYNPVNFIAAVITIPVTTQDTDRTGIIIESLAAESHYTLIPAYYEVTLKTKYLRDNESEEMLDLIFSTRAYDIGECFGWGKLAGNFLTMIYRGENNFSSMYATFKDTAQTEIEEYIDNFSKIG